jgi:hypothetical protein
VPQLASLSEEDRYRLEVRLLHFLLLLACLVEEVYEQRDWVPVLRRRFLASVRFRAIESLGGS